VLFHNSFVTGEAMSFVKSQRVVIEGKTKVVTAVEGDDRFVIQVSKDKVTKNDDPDATITLEGKGAWSTTTTSRVFEVLRDAGLPVAYVEQTGANEFVAPNCRMIPLECIARRKGTGSYRKRNPHQPDGIVFHRLLTEYFLKTTRGVLRHVHGGESRVMPDNPANADNRPDDDPFIVNPQEGTWRLSHSKLPVWDPSARIVAEVSNSYVLPEGVTIPMLDELTRKVFLVLEGAWGTMGFRVVDFKIEYGVDHKGKLLVADVIDADSWRMKSPDGAEVSKQIFRDNRPASELAEKYALAARLSERLHIPKQAIVLWRGSKDDSVPDIPKIPGVEVVDLVCSAHKSPARTLLLLDDVLNKFPGGGAIIAVVGMSNGLGPLLSARTSWPVFGVPAKFGDRPHDVWSSLELPSNVPMLTVANPKNAVLAALNHLAMSNPAVYAARQFDIEELDK
jgi:phosphoribosylaminoimidazole carboxylase/phosphoribosylaminoimidazole-succinocarboxamide synthase